VITLCAFFTELHQRPLSLSAVKGYRSALNTVFRAAGQVHLLEDYRLSNLFRAFGVDRPVTKTLFPGWDLPLVLRSLLEVPYEPLGGSSVKDLTKKTVFLLALASGRRRGELAALSTGPLHLRFARDYSTVTFLPSVHFRSKTQKPLQPSASWVIPALTPLVGLEPDRLLCPVRALRCYLQRTLTSPLRRPESQLFLPTSANVLRTSPAMVSRWIQQVVMRAYLLEPQASDSDNARITAHEVRALAASWTASNSVPLEEVLQAASWQHATTFTSHYLRDMCHQREGLYALGPLVIGQHVVSK